MYSADYCHINGAFPGIVVFNLKHCSFLMGRCLNANLNANSSTEKPANNKPIVAFLTTLDAREDMNANRRCRNFSAALPLQALTRQRAKHSSPWLQEIGLRLAESQLAQLTGSKRSLRGVMSMELMRQNQHRTHTFAGALVLAWNQRQSACRELFPATPPASSGVFSLAHSSNSFRVFGQQ